MHVIILIILGAVGMVYNFIIALIVNGYSEKPLPVLIASSIGTLLSCGAWYIWNNEYLAAITVGSIAIPAGMIGFYAYAYWEIKNERGAYTGAKNFSLFFY